MGVRFMFTFVCQRRLVTILGAVLALAVFLVAAKQAYAAFNVADPIPGQIRLFAVDAEPSGNTATSVVDVDTAHQAAVGTTFNVDLVVDEIAAQNAILGWDMNFHYNPSILSVTGFNGQLMLAADPGSSLYDASDVPPDSDGDFFTGIVDLSEGNEEIGEGVLARLTLECLAPGTSTLFVDYVLIGSPDPSIYYDADPSSNVDIQPIPIITNQGATAQCTSSPSVTPTNTPGPTSTAGPSGSTGPSSTAAGSSSTPLPSASGQPVGGSVTLAYGASANSSPPAWYIAPPVALAAALAAYVISRRRRGQVE